MPSGVTCVVNSCSYWDKGNECIAEKIEIQTDYLALLRGLESEFATELDGENLEITHSVDTCCKTYQLKGSEENG